jgi:hypothetical protein
MWLVPPFALADPSCGVPARVVWHEPEPADGDHLVPGAGGFSYHALEGDDRRGPIPGSAKPHGPVRRPLARCVRRLGTLSRFLGGDRLTIGDDALCEVTERPSRNVSVFSAARFGPRTYHLHLKGVDVLPRSVEDFAAVNLVTGCCLFTERALQLTAADGSPIGCLTPGAKPIRTPVSGLVCSRSMTLYELESVLRLSWLAADVVASLPPWLPVSVTLDVPRIQYYLYVLAAHYDGFLSQDLMLRWCELVRERANWVSDRLQSRLGGALAWLRVARPVTLQRATGLAPLEGLILESVRARRAVEPSRMAATLAEVDPVWREVLAAVTPASYRHLVHLSYAVEQLRAGMPSPRGRRLCIAVDNRSERRTNWQARAVSAALAPAPRESFADVLGLYPLERVLTTQPTGRPDLYDHDPGREFVDDRAQPFGIEELLERAYADLPVHAASRWDLSRRRRRDESARDASTAAMR